LRKLISYLNNYSYTKVLLLIPIIVIVNSCVKKENKMPSEYIARVNSSFFTKEDLKFYSPGNNRILDNITIYNWIDNELLYQEAQKKNITDKEEYNKIIENAKRTLAASILLEEVITDSLKKYKFNDLVLQNYYESHINEFISNEKIYHLITFEFDNETEAEDFRIKNNNNLNIQKYKIDYIEESKLNYKIKKLLSEIKLNTFSKPIKKDNIYKLYYLIGTTEENEPIPYYLVKDQIKERYLATLKRNIVKNYLNSLYKENKIELKISLGN